MKKSIITIICASLVSVASASTPINQGASFDIGFSPKQGSLDLVIQAINSSKTSIHVAAYSFTSKPIAEALLKASKRGVDVKIIADQKSNSGKYSATTYLANNNIQVKLDGNYPIFHHKFMVIDGVNLETGSFNYSAAAANSNAENVLVLWNVPAIAKTYDSEWNQLWSEATLIKPNY